MSACAILHQSFSYPKKKYVVRTFLKKCREIEKIVKESRRKLDERTGTLHNGIKRITKKLNRLQACCCPFAAGLYIPGNTPLAAKVHRTSEGKGGGCMTYVTWSDLLSLLLVLITLAATV